MLRRRRTTVVGLAVGAIVAAGWFAIDDAPAAGGRAATVPVAIRGAVEASGLPVGAPDDWGASRLDAGRYVLLLPADMTVSVESWDSRASVTARPVAAGTWTVDFDAGTTPVDAAFSFTATADEQRSGRSAGASRGDGIGPPSP